MPTVDMRTTIEAPQLRPPNYGLIAAALAADLVSEDGPPLRQLLDPATRDNGPGEGDLGLEQGTPAWGGTAGVDQRWLNGWKFVPEPCTGGGAGAILCDGDTSMIPQGDSPGEVTGDPIFVWAGDRCSTVGWQYRDYVGRALRLLAGVQSYELAAELWTGAISTAAGLGNLTLNDLSGDPQTTVAATPDVALSYIEQGLSDRLRGRRGMVHMTPQLLTLMVANGKLRREGNLWLTAMDSIVVADAGYDGSGPGGVAPGATQWIYGTSMIRVMLGPIAVWPGPDKSDAVLRQAINRDINEITYYAERPAGWLWDRCGLVSAEVNEPIGDLGGTPGS